MEIVREQHVKERKGEFITFEEGEVRAVMLELGQLAHTIYCAMKDN